MATGRQFKITWIILIVSAGLGLVFAILLAITPNSILPDPSFRVGDAPLAVRIWGVTWIAFSLVALVLLLIPYRRANDGRGFRSGCCRSSGSRTSRLHPTCSRISSSGESLPSRSVSPSERSFRRKAEQTSEAGATGLEPATSGGDR